MAADSVADLKQELEMKLLRYGTVGVEKQRDAMDHVAGYCVVNDLTERGYQTERGGTWDKGNGCDAFGPTGLWMVTRDEVPDPQDLSMWLDVDSERVQNGTRGP
jgi:2-keto-4-pentenoate hydratase/2-oxohepta-3-ene-1,7-dioic acid hydratase in catechol pathway